MLKSFINAKTGEKVRVNMKWELSKEQLENQLKVEITWEMPFEDVSVSKRWRPKKRVLEDNKEE